MPSYGGLRGLLGKGWISKDPTVKPVRQPEEVDFCSHFYRKAKVGLSMEFLPNPVERIMATILLDLSASAPSNVEDRKSLLKGVLLTTRATCYPIPWVRFLTEAGLVHLGEVDPKTDWRHREVMVAHPSTIYNKLLGVEVEDHDIGYFSTKDLDFFGNNAKPHIIAKFLAWDPTPAFDRIRNHENRKRRKTILNETLVYMCIYIYSESSTVKRWYIYCETLVFTVRTVNLRRAINRKPVLQQDLINEFNSVKESLLTATPLRSPPANADLVLYVDYSQEGMGAVLMWHEGEKLVVAMYLSRRTTTAEEKMSPIEGEASCIKWALECTRMEVTGAALFGSPASGGSVQGRFVIGDSPAPADEKVIMHSIIPGVGSISERVCKRVS